MPPSTTTRSSPGSMPSPRCASRSNPGRSRSPRAPRPWRDLYRRAEVLICNREEAVEIGGGDHGRMDDLLDSLHRLGPRDRRRHRRSGGGLRVGRLAALPGPRLPRSRPPQGADRRRRRLLVCARRRPGQGSPAGEALAWAPVNAMSVVQEVGSQSGLLSESQLRRYLADAPESYAVTTW